MNFFRRRKINLRLIGKRTIFIDKLVKIGKNVTIYPGNIIIGKTIIEDNVVLKAGNYIKDSVIKSGANIEYSHIEESVVCGGANVGPYARLRPKSEVGENCKVGNFVEIKNSVLGAGTKASHLAYIGDANIGKNCNIGCGAIFVNYNGKEKNRTEVGDNCFIGSNVNVIAPVKIADESYICAGSTLTVNTKQKDFVIARCRETIKPNYADKYKK